MAYTVETRTDTSKIQKLFETAEMKIWRKILRNIKMLRDRTRNEEIRMRYRIEEINQ